LRFLGRFSLKVANNKFKINPLSCGRFGTDKHDEDSGRLSRLCECAYKCSSVKELSENLQPKRLSLTIIVIVMTMLNDKFCTQENEFQPRQLACSSLNFLSLITFPANSAFPPVLGRFFS
jgi:hypothetical protein